MGKITHRIKRSELAAGDHIYTWRTLFVYSHHGIYVGGGKVVHFTQPNIVSEDPILFSTPSKCSSASSTNVSASSTNVSSSKNVSASSKNVSLNVSASSKNVSSNVSASSKNVSSNVSASSKNMSWSKNVSALSKNVSSNVSASSKNVSASSTNVPASSTSVSSTCTIPDCGFQQKDSGVVLSCLDCFLDGGRLYRFEYGVSMSFFLSRVRGGTCTTAQFDPPEEVIHRAMYLLQHGFGNYDVLTNNCEDFALYCKTGLVSQEARRSISGQALYFKSVSAPAILSLPLKLLTWNPILAFLSSGVYHFTRWFDDLGVRLDVTKVKVEELTSFRNQKSSTRTINHNHTDTRELLLLNKMKDFFAVEQRYVKMD